MQSTQPIRADHSAGTETGILEAARRLFSAHGFNGVSMRAIAEAANVSKANIYHHFASKEALYAAVLRSSVVQTRALLEALADPAQAFDERIERFTTAHLANMQEHATAYRLMLREALAGDDKHDRALVEHVVGDNFRQLVDILRAGQDAGVLRADCDPVLCASLLLGSNVFFFQARGVLGHIDDVHFASDPAKYSRGVADLLLHGMLAVPRRRRPR